MREKEHLENSKKQNHRKGIKFLIGSGLAFSLMTVFVKALGERIPVAELVLARAIFSLLIIIPSIAVGVRRLHDTNHSGWWYLLIIIPIIGWIVILIWLCKNSDEGDNRFGSNPKKIAEIS